MGDLRNIIFSANKGLRNKGTYELFFFWLSTFLTVGLYPFDISLINKYGVTTSFFIILFASLTFIITALVGMLGFFSGKYTLLITKQLFSGKIVKIIGIFNWTSLIGWQTIIVYTFYQMLESCYFYNTKINSFVILFFSFFVVCFPPLFGSSAIFKLKNIFSVFFIIMSLTILFNGLLFIKGMEYRNDLFCFSFGGMYAIYMASVISSISYAVVSSDYTRFIIPESNGLSVFSSVFFGSMIGILLNYLVALVLYEHGQLSVISGNIVISPTKTPVFIQLMLFISLISANMPNSYSSFLNLRYVTLKNKFKVNSLSLFVTFMVLSSLVFLRIDLITYLYKFMSILAIFLFPWVGVLFSYSLFVLRRSIHNFYISISQRNGLSLILLICVVISSLFYAKYKYIGALELCFSFLLSWFFFLLF